MYEDYRKLFEDKNLILLVDTMAQRYSKLPHEILTELSVFEFNLDVAIMMQAISYRNRKEEGGIYKDGKNFNPQKDAQKFGLNYTVKRVKKGEMTDG